MSKDKESNNRYTTKVHINDKELLQELDKQRGLVSRAKYINHIVEKQLKLFKPEIIR